MVLYKGVLRPKIESLNVIVEKVKKEKLIIDHITIRCPWTHEDGLTYVSVGLSYSSIRSRFVSIEISDISNLLRGLNFDSIITLPRGLKTTEVRDHFRLDDLNVKDDMIYHENEDIMYIIDITRIKDIEINYDTYDINTINTCFKWSKHNIDLFLDANDEMSTLFKLLS